MKRLLCMLMVLVLSVSLMAFHVSAAAATAYISGPDEIHAGQTITIILGVNGDNISSVEGQFSFDSSLMSLVEITKKISAKDWMVEAGNENTFFAYDNFMNTPANGKTAILAAKFKINASATPGTAFTISCKDMSITQNGNPVEPANQTFTGVILPPLSSNNDLASLTVSNAELNKAFAAGTTKYTASVPFSTENLEVSATAADSKAKVTIGSTKLAAGTTTNVTIKVKAEDGSTKTYTIAVTRAADPNASQPSTPTEPAIPDNTEPTVPATDPIAPTTQPESNDSGDQEKKDNDNCVCSWLWILTAVFGIGFVVMLVLYLDLKKKMN